MILRADAKFSSHIGQAFLGPDDAAMAVQERLLSGDGLTIVLEHGIQKMRVTSTPPAKSPAGKKAALKTPAAAAKKHKGTKSDERSGSSVPSCSDNEQASVVRGQTFQSAADVINFLRSVSDPHDRYDAQIETLEAITAFRTRSADMIEEVFTKLNGGADHHRNNKARRDRMAEATKNIKGKWDGGMMARLASEKSSTNFMQQIRPLAKFFPEEEAACRLNGATIDRLSTLRKGVSTQRSIRTADANVPLTPTQATRSFFSVDTTSFNISNPPQPFMQAALVKSEESGPVSAAVKNEMLPDFNRIKQRIRNSDDYYQRAERHSVVKVDNKENDVECSDWSGISDSEPEEADESENEDMDLLTLEEAPLDSKTEEAEE
ncbi:hypothetical protein G7Y89_g8809 [Cudoniella acicularis]|uniref:Uncharacterized protein n=1 Tax=Cudoniella acicularis TaxID=354080 RepID=A0A8H4RFY3_9HELO|nr:hypothetical protein G7Y89_g8809 [Cudoniella acicularis]